MPIRALDVLDVLDCPHRVYLNHNGDPALRSPITHFMELLHENGVKHETEVIQDFEYELVLGEDFRALFDTTLGLMRRGARLIYQGALIRDDMRGRPDLLARRDGATETGNPTPTARSTSARRSGRFSGSPPVRMTWGAGGPNSANWSRSRNPSTVVSSSGFRLGMASARQ